MSARDALPALDPYDFDLPDAAIARHPAPERDRARLLVVGAGLDDASVADLPERLAPGDLLVVNDVRVHPARLRARRATGGAVEVLLAGPHPAGWEAFVRPSRRIVPGERLGCGPGEVELVERLPGGTWAVRCHPDVDTLTAAAGEIPLPPYLGRPPTAADAERYQTVYARAGRLRAAAAPTAGLHFTAALLDRLAARGVARASVTLEVGAGTFKPLDAEALARGELHPERFVVPEATWAALAAARARGGRVVAVGTTVARVLESAEGPGEGTTRLFVREGHRFRRVDRLFTNFHLPRSSLLMLVAAFGGHARVMAAYRHAVAAGYRFYSYGDAMLLDPDRSGHAGSDGAG